MNRRTPIRTLIALLAMYLILLIPDRSPAPFHAAASRPFAWNLDEKWQFLEQAFIEATTLKHSTLDSIKRIHVVEAETLYNMLQQDSIVTSDDERLANLLEGFFAIAPIVAASKETAWYLDYYSSCRQLVKRQSQAWDLTDTRQRATTYKLLYGMRAAIEEVLLQSDTIQFNPVQHVTDEPSGTPSTILQGIEVHSGDLLVSRGGAEVSAFISRGNDYAGNFSHVALLYVDEENHVPYFIEAHIEKGVAIASAEEYLKDRKLRFMVLRPRASLPELAADPMLPHKAALTALNEARARHIPYDFKMNFFDSTAMFCSEVGSYAYRKHGLQLWQAESTISSQGTANWLNAFGVEHFATQMPSDLEYDPQLSIVAEWCDPETLMKDHLDNAVMDALLERADNGLEISYSYFLLPVARIVKAYSMVQNAFGVPGVIPEGMSATQALKNNAFVEMYQSTHKATQQKINSFITEKGYRPPYWQIVTFAGQSCPISQTVSP